MLTFRLRHIKYSSKFFVGYRFVNKSLKSIYKFFQNVQKKIYSKNNFGFLKKLQTIVFSYKLSGQSLNLSCRILKIRRRYLPSFFVSMSHKYGTGAVELAVNVFYIQGGEFKTSV